MSEALPKTARKTGLRQERTSEDPKLLKEPSTRALFRQDKSYLKTVQPVRTDAPRQHNAEDDRRLLPIEE